MQMPKIPEVGTHKFSGERVEHAGRIIVRQAKSAYLINELTSAESLSFAWGDGDKDCFLGDDYREIPIASQGKSNHNLCGIRLDGGSEAFQE